MLRPNDSTRDSLPRDEELLFDVAVGMELQNHAERSSYSFWWPLDVRLNGKLLRFVRRVRDPALHCR